MTRITLNLQNFSQKDALMQIFEKYTNDFEYTSDGIFRRVVPPMCSCGTRMNHNGYNTHYKKDLGSVKIGRYECPLCKETYEEERSFWEEIKEEFFSLMNKLYQHLRSLHVSYEGISDIMDFIFPRGKDTIYNSFNSSVEHTEIPPIKNVRIVHYDEQYPKEGRTQKYRLTLLDHVTGQPIADDLYDSKDSTTIKEFLEKHLDPNQQIFVITDIANGYPSIFKDFFGKNVIHQLCLLHLNKLILKDFPKRTTMEQELTKYKLLNIFYNRDNEIEFLKKLAEEEKIIKQKNDKGYLKWLKKQRYLFKRFLHDLELKKRREKQNLEQRSYKEAFDIFDDLTKEFYSFSTPVRKRLEMIKKNWKYFTAFYFVEGAPATNNLLENYYSTSLKTHRKKQLRNDKGIENHMKLSAMKRAGMFKKPKKTLLEVFLKFIPFLNLE